MIKTVMILDMLKARLGSDYKTAKALGVPPNYISRWRSEGHVMKDEYGLKAAQLLDFPEEAILLSLAAERALNSESFQEISRLADKYLPEKLPTTEAPPSKHAKKKAI